MDLRVRISTFETLNARFEVFSDMETIKALNETFLPKIKELHKNIYIMETKTT
jgi:hypothetical protein